VVTCLLYSKVIMQGSATCASVWVPVMWEIILMICYWSTLGRHLCYCVSVTLVLSCCCCNGRPSAAIELTRGPSYCYSGVRLMRLGGKPHLKERGMSAIWANTIPWAGHVHPWNPTTLTPTRSIRKGRQGELRHRTIIRTIRSSPSLQFPLPCSSSSSRALAFYCFFLWFPPILYILVSGC